MSFGSQLRELLSPRMKFYFFLFVSLSLYPSRIRDSRNERVPLVTKINSHSRLFKKILPLLSLYLSISTLVHGLLVIICTISYIHYQGRTSTYLSWFAPDTVATLHINPRISLNLACLLSLMHLGYRILARFYHQELDMDIISFLCEEETNFELALVANGPQKFDFIKGDHPSQISPLLGVMYCEFADPIRKSISLVLRPNRTRAMRAHMFDKISSLFNVNCVVSSILIATLQYAIHFGQHQSDATTGCKDPSEVSESDDLWQFPSMVSIWQTLIFPLLVENIYLIDTVAGILSAVFFLHILIEDLNLYWLSLMKQVNQLTWELRLIQPLQDSQISRWWASPSHIKVADGPPIPMAPSILSTELSPASFFYSGQEQSLASALNKLDRDLAKLRTCLFDFFRLVGRTDVYVSLLIPFNMAIWLASNALFATMGIQLDMESTDSMAIRLIQLLMFSMTLATSGLALSFKRKIELAYSPLCNLVALDGSAEKASWCRVLAFYDPTRPRYAFTLLGFKIYSKLTYLSIISYTITFALLVESFNAYAPN